MISSLIKKMLIKTPIVVLPYKENSLEWAVPWRGNTKDDPNRGWKAGLSFPDPSPTIMRF